MWMTNTRFHNVVKSFLKEHSYFNEPAVSRDIYEEVTLQKNKKNLVKRQILNK